ncbi:hypothetical protein ACFE04_028290 [Oxalis oulophora]
MVAISAVGNGCENGGVFWIFASPIYEYLDTKYGIKGSALAPKNLRFRVCVRCGFLAINTLFSALLLFLRDFMSLTGAINTFPLRKPHVYYGEADAAKFFTKGLSLG